MRIMRLLVMFDLPTGNKSERRSYAKFRKFLLKDGYHMDQFSVYSRITVSRDNTDNHLARLRANLPEAGAVTAMVITEDQYSRREVLVDTRTTHDSKDYGAQMTLTF